MNKNKGVGWDLISDKIFSSFSKGKEQLKNEFVRN